MKELTNKVIKEHIYHFGDGFSIKTVFIANGDDGSYFINQKLTLNSDCNCAEIQLYTSILSSNDLRILANELDMASLEVRTDLKILEEEIKKDRSLTMEEDRSLTMDGKIYKLVEIKKT